MSIRIRRPATDRLELLQGDYLLVKQDLTAREHREVMRASFKPATASPVAGAPPPDFELDPVAGGLAVVLAYLLDWSFLDADSRPIVVANQPASVVRAALDHIDSDAYMEVQNAINAHVAARAAALAEEKKTRSGLPAPDRTLTSVA